MKQVIHFTLLILLLNLCFLFSPRPRSETNFCGEYIPLNAHAGFIRNCDANEFIESAISPSALMRDGYVRQGRPLYVIAASGIGYTIYYSGGLFKSIYKLSLTKSIYIAYVCLNFGILLLALCLFEKIVMIITDGTIPYVVILMLSVFIASNFMTKAFFWTVHQQMLAFLVPLLGIYISIRFIKGVSEKRLLLLFLLLGIGMLAYGSFLVLFTLCILYLCYTLYVQKRLLEFRSIKLLVISGVLFVLPTVCWILFLKYNGITYYNHEMVRYRQLVWIADAWSVSTADFLSACYLNLLQFLNTLTKLYIFIILLLVALLSRKIKSDITFHFDRNSKLILLNLVCFAFFCMILGYYAYRLTFTLMPVMLCLSIANASEMLQKRQVQIALLLTVSMWHAVNVFSYGPFS